MSVTVVERVDNVLFSSLLQTTRIYEKGRLEIVVEILSVLDLWDIHWFLYFRITSTCRCD